MQFIQQNHCTTHKKRHATTPEEAVLPQPRYQAVVSEASSVPGLPVSLAFDGQAVVDKSDVTVELLKVQCRDQHQPGHPCWST